MGLCEEKGRVYAASSNVKELSFPDCKVLSKFNNSSHARISLTENGQYLALYRGINYLYVYNTDDLNQPLFKTSWSDAVYTTTKCCPFGETTLLVPVQNALYSIDMNDPKQTILVYGDSRPSQERWHQMGHIKSVSSRGDEVVLLHHSFEPYTRYAFYSKGDSIQFSEKRKISFSISAGYDNLLLKPGGGVCLFSSRDGSPMLYYESFPDDFSEPDALISLPRLFSPCFSHDGKYLTFQTDVDSYPYPGAWLVETTNWSVVRKITDRIVVNPSFSNHDRYWLVPSRKPLIVDLS